MKKLRQWNFDDVNVFENILRNKINKIIKKYNIWIDQYQDDDLYSMKLFLKIKKLLKHELIDLPLFDSSKEELNEMKENISETLISNINKEINKI